VRSRTRVTVTAVALTAAASTMALFSESAEAGSNGQQINFCTYSADHLTSDVRNSRVEATGTNQDGARHSINVPFNATSWGNAYGCDENSTDWWVGPVDLVWHYTDGSTKKTTCDVPKEYPVDRFQCFDDE